MTFYLLEALGCESKGNPKDREGGRLAMPRIQIPVRGMQCVSCERTVQAALTEIEGVRDAEADHRVGRVRVSFDPEQVDEQRLRAGIEQAGYEPVAEELG